MPEGGFGVRVERFMCRPEVLPRIDKSILNQEFIISTRNNFISDLYQLPLHN